MTNVQYFDVLAKCFPYSKCYVSLITTFLLSTHLCIQYVKAHAACMKA